ncbi:hypothetical protein ES703_24585 [subsurface metagenome]
MPCLFIAVLTIFFTTAPPAKWIIGILYPRLQAPVALSDESRKLAVDAGSTILRRVGVERFDIT